MSDEVYDYVGKAQKRSLEYKVTNLEMDMSKISTNIYMVRDESIEKNKRATIIVVRGLLENNEKEDQDLASEIY